MGMERQKYAFKVYQVWEVLVSPLNFDWDPEGMNTRKKVNLSLNGLQLSFK